MQFAEPCIYWRHLSCVQVRALLNKATMSIHGQVPRRCWLWTSCVLLQLHTPPSNSHRSISFSLSYCMCFLPSLLLILKVPFTSSHGTLSSFLVPISSYSHINMYILKLEARTCIWERTSDIYCSETVLPQLVFSGSIHFSCKLHENVAEHYSTFSLSYSSVGGHLSWFLLLILWMKQ